jgi:hypothetical protein
MSRTLLGVSSKLASYDKDCSSTVPSQAKAAADMLDFLVTSVQEKMATQSSGVAAATAGKIHVKILYYNFIVCL